VAGIGSVPDLSRQELEALGRSAPVAEVQRHLSLLVGFAVVLLLVALCAQAGAKVTVNIDIELGLVLGLAMTWARYRGSNQ
jgi:hypothetical protein